MTARFPPRWLYGLTLLIGIEAGIRLLAGFFNVGAPLLNKWISGATITVPQYEDGVVVAAQAPPSGGATALSRAKNASRLFGQGVLLLPLNEPYRHMRAYRREFQKFTGNPYIPYVRRSGVVHPFEGRPFVTDENGFLIFPTTGSAASPRTVLTLGDSTTDSAYPYFLWKRLNATQAVRVVNAALPSYTTADSLAVLLFRGLDYKPDAIVLYQANNDIFPASVDPKGEAFRSDYSHWRGSYRSDLIGRWIGFDRLPGVFDASAIFCLLRAAITRDASETFRWGIWGVTSKYTPVLNDPARYQDTAAFRRNLVSLCGLASAHGARLVLVTQLHQPAKMAGPEFAFAERLNDVVREVAHTAGPGVTLVDFARRHAAERDALLVRDGVHFDDPGYRLLGEETAAAVQQALR